MLKAVTEIEEKLGNGRKQLGGTEEWSKWTEESFASYMHVFPDLSDTADHCIRSI